DNLLALKLPVQREPTSGITAWAGEYAAAQVSVLDRRIDLDPELGALIAFPGQEVLVAVPIVDQATVMSLLEGRFGRFVSQVIERTSTPLSTGVFWWYDGKILEIEFRSGSPVLPPDLAKRIATRSW